MRAWLAIVLCALVAATLPACALALPVRVEAMTLHKPDAAGNAALTPDTPEPGAALATGAGNLLEWAGRAVGGPWGDLLALGGVTLLGAGGYHVGHRKGARKAAGSRQEPRSPLSPSAG